MKKSNLLLFFCIIVCLISCSSQKTTQKGPARAFYYWKTILNLEKEDIKYFESIGITKLYLRLFDLTVESQSKEIKPTNKLRLKNNSLLFNNLVPVIFIENEVLVKLNKDNIDALSTGIINELVVYQKMLSIDNYREIQIDCDWTKSSKERYFSLLNVLENKINEKYKGAVLTVTIRQHQIKFRSSTGIPPVKRGALMFYGARSPLIYEEKNTILNYNETKEYIHTVGTYPINLDYILPIYSWAIQYNKDNKFVRLYTEEELHSIKENTDLIKIGKYIYVAKANTFINNKHVFKEDKIKIEMSDYNECVKIAEYAGSILSKEADTTIALFSYDKNSIERFTNENPKKLVNIFGRH